MASRRSTEAGTGAADGGISHPTPLVLARYLDGGLAGGHAAAVLAHALLCGECGGRLAKLAAGRGYRFVDRVDDRGRRTLVILPGAD